jgi:hypothetical protein
MRRKTLLALVAVAVVLFGLTLNSCKDCNSGRNRGKGKDPLGNGSSEDNLANKNNPATPLKERDALTPEEKQAKLNKLKAELVAAAEVVIMDGEDDAHKSPNMKVKHMTYGYNFLAYGAADEEKWFSYLYWMCFYQKDWANYLKEACEACNNEAPENDNEAKDKENAKKQKVLAKGMEEKGRVAAAEHKGIDWNRLNLLLGPVERDWGNLLAAEKAYRDGLRGKFKP